MRRPAPAVGSGVQRHVKSLQGVLADWRCAVRVPAARVHPVNTEHRNGVCWRADSIRSNDDWGQPLFGSSFTAGLCFIDFIVVLGSLLYLLLFFRWFWKVSLGLRWFRTGSSGFGWFHAV